MQTISIANETLTTPKELADKKIISEVKQYEERKLGRLKCIRIGTKILYRASHISDYLDLCEQNSQTGEQAN